MRLKYKLSTKMRTKYKLGKRCASCRKLLALKDFHVRKNGAPHAYCASCVVKITYAWRRKNRKRWLKTHRDYYRKQRRLSMRMG